MSETLQKPLTRLEITLVMGLPSLVFGKLTTNVTQKHDI